MTEPEPTPVFRRFPWIQLVFCLACLSMTAWTWMRYSYCWDVAVRDLPVLPKAWNLISGPSGIPHVPVDFDFVQIREDLSRRAWPESFGDHWLRNRYVRVKGCVVSVLRLSDTPHSDGTRDPGYWIPVISDGTGQMSVLLPPSRGKPSRDWDEKAFRGRLVLTPSARAAYIGPPDPALENSKPLSLDSCVGRWHHASIAGLVVGAMGCFIFGLYLRGWLVERKALASQPGQDMIA